MDNSQNYSLIDSDCIPQRDIENEYADWFHDAASEADWAENISLRDIESRTTCSLAESVNSMTLIDELYEKNKILERQWKEAEDKYRNLQVENQKLFIQLSNERHRANRYHKKLQFIQDNQEIFNRLKQAYLYMKYNEATGRTMVEIRERACQTWEGILCEACIETAEMKRKADLERLCSFTGSEPEMVTVKKSDLLNLKQTVQTLKDMIDRREKSWSYNAERENNYKSTISELQGNIKILSSLITSERINNATLQPTENCPDVIAKENGFLRKIIVKLEKRHRDMEKLHKSDKRPPLLNEDERSMVRQLIKKYASKLKQKATRSLSCETGMSRTTRTPRIAASPRSSITTDSSELSRAIGAGEGTGVGDRIGGDEGVVFNIPIKKPRSKDRNIEKAEKPFAPNKKDSVEQIDLIDFSDSCACTSAQT